MDVNLWRYRDRREYGAKAQLNRSVATTAHADDVIGTVILTETGCETRICATDPEILRDIARAADRAADLIEAARREIAAREPANTRAVA